MVFQILSILFAVGIHGQVQTPSLSDIKHEGAKVIGNLKGQINLGASDLYHSTRQFLHSLLPSEQDIIESELDRQYIINEFHNGNLEAVSNLKGKANELFDNTKEFLTSLLPNPPPKDKQGQSSPLDFLTSWFANPDTERDSHHHHGHHHLDHAPKQSSCFTRTCDQTITGRRLTYGRALQIVQNEEYLSAVDLDIIRRRLYEAEKRKQAVESFEQAQQERKDILEPLPKLPKFKYKGPDVVGFVGDVVGIVGGMGSEVFDQALDGYDRISDKGADAINNFRFNPLETLNSLGGEDYGGDAFQTRFDDFVYHEGRSNRVKRFLLTTTNFTIDEGNGALGDPGKVFGLGILGALVLIYFWSPDLQLVGAGEVPPGYPQPGTNGGGIPPVGNSPVVLEALSLLPPNTIPVAVFPPYASIRTYPAVTIIFQETGIARKRRKRGISDRVLYRINSMRKNWSYVRRRMIRGGPRTSFWWKRQFRCFKSRINRYLATAEIKFDAGPGPYTDYQDPDHYDRSSIYKSFPNFDVQNRFQINSYEDCFDDIQEPLYGFRTRVRSVNNEPCEINVSCDFNGNKLGGFAHHYRKKRQTGEEFFSDAAPDCRTNRIC